MKTTSRILAHTCPGFPHILARECRCHPWQCQCWIGVDVHHSRQPARRANLLEVPADDCHWGDANPLPMRVCPQSTQHWSMKPLLIFQRPIQTYGRQAAAKSRINPRHHAIAFMGKTPPEPTPEEVDCNAHNLMLPPVRIDKDIPTDFLDPCSRICYSEIYPVHLNVRVKAVGVINPKSYQAFVDSYLAVVNETIVPSSGTGRVTIGQAAATQPTQPQAEMSSSTSRASGTQQHRGENENIDSFPSQAHSTSPIAARFATLNIHLTQPTSHPHPSQDFLVNRTRISKPGQLPIPPVSPSRGADHSENRRPWT